MEGEDKSFDNNVQLVSWDGANTCPISFDSNRWSFARSTSHVRLSYLSQDTASLIRLSKWPSPRPPASQLIRHAMIHQLHMWDPPWRAIAGTKMTALLFSDCPLLAGQGSSLCGFEVLGNVVMPSPSESRRFYGPAFTSFKSPLESTPGMSNSVVVRVVPCRLWVCSRKWLLVWD